MGFSVKSDVNSQTPRINKILGQTKRRKKVTLVFDEDKRRDFLGGFHKRKVQRQKKAQEEVQRQFKEERKKIKQDARKRYKDVLTNRDIPELERLLSEKEYDMDGRTISVLELNVADLNEGNQWIGDNKSEDKITDVSEQNSMPCVHVDEDVRGMSLMTKEINDSEMISHRKTIVNGKDLKRITKRATLEQMRKSKVFQKKQRLENQRNRKRSKRNTLQIEKLARKKK